MNDLSLYLVILIRGGYSSQKKSIYIKETRMDEVITQEEIANRLNINCNVCRKWETGEREFPLEELVMFADIVDVSINYLL